MFSKKSRIHNLLTHHHNKTFLSYFILFSLIIIIPFSFAYSETPIHPACKKVRFSDVGWTDISATTAVATEILNSLGYETKTTQISVPVTYISLKNNDIDVFLGNWMPSMSSDIAPYQKNGTVETIGALLENARYTLAVPQYVYDAGIHSIHDLKNHFSEFEGKIFGIEPGNDGNRLIHKMIEDQKFGSKTWKLIESSEQAMLSQVLQAVKTKKWIVFLGWEPHPMNSKIQMSYLKDADGYFGPNQGSSTVFINTRKNYSRECPNVTQFLNNFHFTIDLENSLLSMVLEQKLEPKLAARKWIKQNQSYVKNWLKGVKTIDGQDGLTRVSELWKKSQ